MWTRSFLGLSAGARLESDDSDDKLFAKTLDISATTGRRRRAKSAPRPVQPAATPSPGPPSPGPLSRRTSLPDLREVAESPQVSVEKLREQFDDVHVRPSSPPQGASSPTSVGSGENERTTAAAIEGQPGPSPRDVNDNHTEEKPNLAVRLLDIKPRFRLVEPPPRLSVNCEVTLRVQGGKVVGHRQDGDDLATTAAIIGVAHDAVVDYLRDQQPPPKRRCQHRPIQMKVEWPVITLKGDREVQKEYSEPEDMLVPKEEPSSGEEEGEEEGQ